MSHAYIGLGSNLQGPRRQLEQALDELAALPHSRLLKASGFYLSPPLGPADQPDYLNAVALLETDLAPLALLDRLQALEHAQGRVRTRRWGPRTLDLDLLLYGRRRIDHPRLTVPHPGIDERDFVLKPLAEIAPRLEVPGLGRVEALLAQCPLDTARRLHD